MKTMIQILATLALTAPTFAQAAPNTTSKQLDQVVANEKVCMDKAQSNVDMKECSGNAYRAADKVLNQVYAQTVAGLKVPDLFQSNKEILRRLIASEKAWISFRDADCDLQGTSMLGGTGESLVISECYVEKTISRVKDLSAL